MYKGIFANLEWSKKPKFCSFLNYSSFQLKTELFVTRLDYFISYV